MTTSERIQRVCTGCGQTDDHPHHLTVAAITYKDPISGEMVTEDKSVSRHLDCCNCEHCSIVLAHSPGKHGLDLVSHLEAAPPEMHAALNAAGFDTGAS